MNPRYCYNFRNEFFAQFSRLFSYVLPFSVVQCDNFYISHFVEIINLKYTSEYIREMFVDVLILQGSIVIIFVNFYILDYMGPELIPNPTLTRGVGTTRTLWPRVNGELHIPYTIDSTSMYNNFNSHLESKMFQKQAMNYQWAC